MVYEQSVLDWAYKKQITQEELQVLYQEWQKSKNILVDNQQTQHIDLLVSVEQCHLYFLQNFRSSEEITNRVQFYLDKLNDLYNKSVLDGSLATKEQVMAVEEIYLKFDDSGQGYLYQYQIIILFQLLHPFITSNHNHSFSPQNQTLNIDFSSKIYKDHSLIKPISVNHTNNYSDARQAQNSIKSFSSFHSRIPLKGFKNMMINSALTFEQLQQIEQSLNQLIEQMQELSTQLQTLHFHKILDSFNIFDPVFSELSEQSLDPNEKKKMIGNISEDSDISFAKEDLDANQLDFSKRFIQIFNIFYKHCLGNKITDKEYLSTNSHQSNKDFSQVYKQNRKYHALNLNSTKLDNTPPDVQKAFTFSQPSTHMSKGNNYQSFKDSLKNSQTSLKNQQIGLKNQQSSFMQKKYTFNFRLDENLLTNSSPQSSKKNLHSKSGKQQQQQQKNSQPLNKQALNKQNVHETTIKQNKTIDFSHLKSAFLYDDDDEQQYHQQNNPITRDIFPAAKDTKEIIPPLKEVFSAVKGKDTMQKRSQSKSPFQPNYQRLENDHRHLQNLQEFSDQYVNTSFISRNKNITNKENHNKESDTTIHLQKNHSNLSLHMKTSMKRLSQTPLKSSRSRAQPTSTKLKEQTGSSKSPQTIRTHKQILKTKRIEPYEKVMENLSNLSNLAPIDLTPRKQTKPFN